MKSKTENLLVKRFLHHSVWSQPTHTQEKCRHLRYFPSKFMVLAEVPLGLWLYGNRQVEAGGNWVIFRAIVSSGETGWGERVILREGGREGHHSAGNSNNSQNIFLSVLQPKQNLVWETKVKFNTLDLSQPRNWHQTNQISVESAANTTFKTLVAARGVLVWIGWTLETWTVQGFQTFWMGEPAGSLAKNFHIF